MIKTPSSVSKPTFYLPKTLGPASILDRICAQVIDIILATVLFLSLSSVFGLESFWIILIIYPFYFFICHSIWGKTLGKKMMGLRLISVRHQSLSWWRVLLRETLARWICIGTLFYGYLQILVKKDRRGLHDQIMGSAVVSDKQYQTSLAHFLAVISVFVLTFSFTFYYLFFKTPIAAKVAMIFLRENGVQISSLQGNFSEGWSVDTFQGKTGTTHYSAQGIHIKQAPVGFYSHGRWQAQSLHIKKLEMKVTPVNTYLSLLNKKVESSATPLKTSSLDLSFALSRLRGFVENVHVDELHVTDGHQLNLHLKDLQLTKVQYESDSITVGSLTSTDIKTASAFVQIQSLVFKPIDQYLNLKMYLTLKKESFKPLKKDTKVFFHWTGPLYAPERLKVFAFDNRINLDYQAGDLSLIVTGLNPADYLASTSSLFTKLTARFKNTDCHKLVCVQFMDGRGHFFLRHKKVEFKNDVAWVPAMGDDLLRFNYKDLISALMSPQPVLKAVSEDTVQDFMAQFYFQKPYHELAANEQEMIAQDQVYFKVLKERFDPNKPKHRDTFLLRSPTELQESK